MKKCVWIILKATVILITLQVSVQAQPDLIAEIPDGSTRFVQVGDMVYFTSGDSLFGTDGTTEGTALLITGAFPRSFTEFKGDEYFLSDNPDLGFELWKTDGTPAGTFKLKTIRGAQFLGHTNEFLYLTTSDPATGMELYITDGTAEGTVLLKDINPGPGDGFRGRSAIVGDFIFFAANDGIHGTELWKSNGSADGTQMVRDIYAGADSGFYEGPFSFPFNSDPVFSHNNLFYFTGNTPENGMEPWVSDGTAEGTILLQDIMPGEESPRSIEFKIGHRETVYFMAYGPKPPDAQERGAGDLWKTNGTMATTIRIETIDGYDFLHHSFLIYNEKVYFFSSALDFDVLWVTDGTSEGTLSFYTLDTVSAGGILFFEEVNDYLLFYGSRDNAPTQFYRSDGTSSGTDEFMVFQSGSYDRYPRAVTKVNDLVFLGDHEHGDEVGKPVTPEDYYQLMQTDGFTTQSVREITGVSLIGTNNIINFKGRVLFTTQNDQFQSTDTQKRLWIYDPAQPPAQDSASFTLVNAETDEDIQTLTEGDTITKPADTLFNIRYNPVGSPGSVVFKHQGKIVRIENAAPFALRGDYSGNYLPWEAGVAGSHKVEATPYSEAGGKGTAGPTLTINFTIEEDADECLASGTILREYWAGVPGARISNIPLDTEPTSMSELTIFEGPENIGTNYATRIRGYICPPATGDYIFWIASNDHSELWLSTDDNPFNKIRIAYVMGATDPRQWNKFASQRSSPIALEQGNRYYIEALHKQGVGTDHIAVGWQLPDGTVERPITGNRLSPFESDTSTMASMADARYSQINIYPNPAPSGAPELRIAGYEGIQETVETQVKIINMTGEVIFDERVICGGNCNTYLMNINKQLVPGVYMIKMNTNGTRTARRLLVK